jgi:YggT family protein
MPASGLALLFIIRIIQIYNILIFARVILSWVIRDPYNPIYRFLLGITEPLLGPIRSIIPNMGLDFSPIVAYLLLNILQRFLISLL